MTSGIDAAAAASMPVQNPHAARMIANLFIGVSFVEMIGNAASLPGDATRRTIERLQARHVPTKRLCFSYGSPGTSGRCPVIRMQR
jgi:hypothetical protein